MAAPLTRVMVCHPDTAGWGDPARASAWRELGYGHAPDPEAAARQHSGMRELLEASGAEVIMMKEGFGLTPDAVYVRDPSLMTDHGAICFNMGKRLRRGEGARHRRFYEEAGIPVLGEVVSPGTAEAGDMVWLDPGRLLVGRGTRTNAQGIEQLSRLLGPRGIEVIPAPLLYGGGPDVCFHLMSILSIPGERVALADTGLMAVETVELLQAREFTIVEIDHSERATQAANVLGLGGGRILAIRENPRTNGRLEAAGFELLTFPADEICQNGGGGPTCLTRPLLRG
jgi:N-dimethylarginine dimethylaminohydrolase